ncbi:MAG: hypothetical protein M9914_05980 [Trueperaceae bacterium]|nr:hypothetical protein [Trueperaceae bacterium]
MMVETEGYESVASLVMGDVDDIFGAGSNPAEAIEDLRITLREARTQLSGMRDRLTPRLLRQLSALETMATFTGFYGPTSSAQDSRERAAAPITSNSADYIRRFKG